MALEWDAAKAASNVVKHGVRFADAALALEDDYAMTVSEQVRGEERLVTLGLDAAGRLLLVVYVLRGPNVRLISARKATAAEERQYSAFRKP